MITHMIKKTSLIILALFSLSCTKESPNEPEPAPPVIVLGESISSVSIGDDSLTVIEKLGPPTGYAAGDFRGSILVYDKGQYDLTYVFISKDSALGLGVISVKINPPYKGVSQENIGVGSERSFVISKLGEPDKTNQTSPIYDTYNYQKNNFVFGYRDGCAYSIIMITRIENNIDRSEVSPLSGKKKRLCLELTKQESYATI